MTHQMAGDICNLYENSFCKETVLKIATCFDVKGKVSSCMVVSIHKTKDVPVLEREWVQRFASQDCISKWDALMFIQGGNFGGNVLALGGHLSWHWLVPMLSTLFPKSAVFFVVQPSSWIKKEINSQELATQESGVDEIEVLVTERNGQAIL